MITDGGGANSGVPMNLIASSYLMFSTSPTLPGVVRGQNLFLGTIKNL